MIRIAAILALLALAACAPISPERAADECEERARAARGATGSVGVGVNSERGAIMTSDITININSDFLTGRDPYEVYDSCVRAKTGQGPIRPLSL